jgi:hypothetical protein
VVGWSWCDAVVALQQNQAPGTYPHCVFKKLLFRWSRFVIASFGKVGLNGIPSFVVGWTQAQLAIGNLHAHQFL